MSAELSDFLIYLDLIYRSTLSSPVSVAIRYLALTKEHPERAFQSESNRKDERLNGSVVALW